MTMSITMAELHQLIFLSLTIVLEIPQIAQLAMFLGIFIRFYLPRQLRLKSWMPEVGVVRGGVRESGSYRRESTSWRLDEERLRLSRRRQDASGIWDPAPSHQRPAVRCRDYLAGSPDIWARCAWA